MGTPYWFRRMADWPRDIAQGIKNLIYWFPIIWADRNWDWYFLAAIIEHKTRKMACQIENYGNCMESEQTAYELYQVASDLKFLMDDDSCHCFDLLDADKSEECYVKHEENMAAAQRRVGIAFSTKLRRWWD